MIHHNKYIYLNNYITVQKKKCIIIDFLIRTTTPIIDFILSTIGDNIFSTII